MSDDSLLLPVRDDYLLELEKNAAERYIPIIKPEVGQFLSVMVKAHRPTRILELGTAVGYSTIWLTRAAGPDVEVVTIEIDEERAAEAERNLKFYGFHQQVKIKIGDALEILPYLRREFDFVFIDAAKGQYINYIDILMEMVPTGGVIIADNVLYRGYVKKTGQIKHKRRTMVNILKDYITLVKSHPELDTSVIPLGDGLAVSVRR